MFAVSAALAGWMQEWVQSGTFFIRWDIGGVIALVNFVIMLALGTDARFLYPNDDAGRQQVLARYRQILDEVNARMPEYFSTVPPGKV